MLDEAGLVDWKTALCQGSGQAFYNTQKFALSGLRERASQQQLRGDFEACLDGFSSDVAITDLSSAK